MMCARRLSPRVVSARTESRRHAERKPDMSGIDLAPTMNVPSLTKIPARVLRGGGDKKSRRANGVNGKDER